MNKKKKRKNNSGIIKLLLILVVLLAAGVTWLVVSRTPSSEHMDMKAYFGEASDDAAFIIVGTETQESRGLILDGTAYLPLDFVTANLNPVFYWAADTGNILYTGSTQIERTPAADTPGSPVRIIGENVYLSTDFVASHTDLDILVGAAPSRIVIQRDFTGLNAVKALRDTAVRVKDSIKADILSDVPADSYMIFLEQQGDWYRVSTWDGCIGFVQAKDTTEPAMTDIPRTFAEDVIQYKTFDGLINLTWDVISNVDTNSYLADRIQDMTGVNVLSPTWFSFSDNDGNFTDLSSAEYVQQAHEKGIQVWGLLDNFSPDVSSYEILSHTASREHLVQELIAAALRVGMDGINIDVESIAPDTIPHFLEFMRELSIETHRNNLYLSFDAPPPEDYTWYYNRGEIGRVADYVIIMGYDEHYDGGDAGSVASLPWVRQGIEDTLTQVPANRTILAVPFYTRVWWEQAGTPHSEVVRQFEQDEYLTANAVQTWWNNELCQNVATWEKDGLPYQLWLEDEQSIAVKTDLIKEYGLAGIASWRLGLEKSTIWNVIQEHLQ